MTSGRAAFRAPGPSQAEPVLVSRACAGTPSAMGFVRSLAPALAFAIRDDNRAVFFGDGITEQRPSTTYLEADTLTRHPTRHLSLRKTDLERLGREIREFESRIDATRQPRPRRHEINGVAS